MRLGRLLLASIFIIAMLTTSALAVKTVTYYSFIEPETVGTWTKYHTLPYFDPAMGNLISVDFTASLIALSMVRRRIRPHRRSLVPILLLMPICTLI